MVDASQTDEQNNQLVSNKLVTETQNTDLMKSVRFEDHVEVFIYGKEPIECSKKTVKLNVYIDSKEPVTTPTADIIHTDYEREMKFAPAGVAFIPFKRYFDA